MNEQRHNLCFIQAESDLFFVSHVAVYESVTALVALFQECDLPFSFSLLTGTI